MANYVMTNQALVEGKYGESECDINFSTNLVSTTVINNLTATKTADKTCWVDGPLTYTIVLSNNSGETITEGVLTDVVVTPFSVFDQVYGIYINGMQTFDYTYFDNEIQLNIPEMEDGVTLNIEFRVLRV